MAAEPERALHVLQRNDPATTEVCIFLFHEPDDLAISHALLGNQNVTYVSVNLTLFDSPRTPFTVGPDNNQGWSSLRRVLSTKQLERITLLGDFKLKGFRPPSQIVKLFLDAVQQNDKVSQVDLVNLKLPGPETAALVNNMTCPIFALRECTIHGSPDEKKKGALAIAEALKKNLTIEAFLFCPKLTAPFMLEIVERLASKKHLQWFAMGLTVTPTKHKERKERNKWYNILIQPYINATSTSRMYRKLSFLMLMLEGKLAFNPCSRQSVVFGRAVSKLRLVVGWTSTGIFIFPLCWRPCSATTSSCPSQSLMNTTTTFWVLLRPRRFALFWSATNARPTAWQHLSQIHCRFQQTCGPFMWLQRKRTASERSGRACTPWDRRSGVKERKRKRENESALNFTTRQRRPTHPCREAEGLLIAQAVFT